MSLYSGGPETLTIAISPLNCCWRDVRPIQIVGVGHKHRTLGFGIATYFSIIYLWPKP